MSAIVLASFRQTCRSHHHHHHHRSLLEAPSILLFQSPRSIIVWRSCRWNTDSTSIAFTGAGRGMTPSGGNHRAWLSSWSDRPSDSASASSSSSSQQHPQQPHPQPFVNTRLRPGEWDPDERRARGGKKSNPLYRPEWRPRVAKVISAEDYAARPRVGFSGEFESMQDAMVTLTWLDHETQKKIYMIYLEWMQHSHQQFQGRTSHEYVIRVLAQKFHMTAERIAGIITLQHNEEQIKRNESESELMTDVAAYMDYSIKKEIDDAYQTAGQRPPDSFVEDPVGMLGRQESQSYTVVDDVFDVDRMIQDAIVREEQDARVAIDGHVYIEDVDEDKIPIPLSADCHELLKRKVVLEEQNEKDAENAKAAVANAFRKKYKQHLKRKELEQEQPLELPLGRTMNAESISRRTRWKFVAQIVNTRDLYKKKHDKRIRNRKHLPVSYVNNHAADTLVEDPNGTLRAGSLADVRGTAWKPVRHVAEFILRDVKRGWLDRTVRSLDSTWGLQSKNVMATPPSAAAWMASGNTGTDNPPRQGDTSNMVTSDSDSESNDDTSSSDSETDKPEDAAPDILDKDDVDRENNKDK